MKINIDIWVIIFSLIYISGVFRTSLLFNIYRYIFIGMILAICKAIFNKQKFKFRHGVKLVFFWLPALWINEVQEWVSK